MNKAVETANAGNLSEAVPLLTRLVDAGETRANCYLGIIYECGGDDVSADYDFSMFYYKKAAEEGWVDGHIGLGRIYYYGLGVVQDLAEAFERFERIDRAGVVNPIADFYLGQMLFLGEGVERNIDRARFFLNRSLNCGYVWSKFRLAALEKSERNYVVWLRLRISVLLQVLRVSMQYGANDWRIGIPTCTMAPSAGHPILVDDR